MADPRPVQILYFAWLRERIGLDHEAIELPDGVRDMAGLIGVLRRRSPRHEAVFAAGATVRCAVNQDFAGPEAAVGAGDEVAFFPPVTGG